MGKTIGDMERDRIAAGLPEGVWLTGAVSFCAGCRKPMPKGTPSYSFGSDRAEFPKCAILYCEDMARAYTKQADEIRAMSKKEV
jgi:hypothetical protein